MRECDSAYRHTLHSFPSYCIYTLDRSTQKRINKTKPNQKNGATGNEPSPDVLYPPLTIFCTTSSAEAEKSLFSFSVVGERLKLK